MLKNYAILLFLLSFFASSTTVTAQKKPALTGDRCGTMPRLQHLLQRNPEARSRFQMQQTALRSAANQRSRGQVSPMRTSATVTIPVVFHVVLSNPALFTDAQIQAQLDTLNKSFRGGNGDSVRIPAHFKSLFGKGNVQFCLAQRTPDDTETTGIIRKTTATGAFGADDAVKRTLTGGTDSWNTDSYLNIWICQMSGGILGYASFPDDGAPLDQGVVIDYRSLPGGAFSSYNGGKTLVHEVGHYFTLHHIWGDDGGACSGTDFIDDTPNQADATSGCLSGIRTDDCTPAGNGIMYQNYMDYSFDACLVMFTPQQLDRMETALSMLRSSLFASKGCQPLVRKNLDVQVRAITSPQQRICEPSFRPVVTIRNNGVQTLTTVTLHAQVDGGPLSTVTWTGSLPTLATASVTLNTLSTTEGQHTLTIYSTAPNGQADEERSSDTLRSPVQFFAPVLSVSESFEQPIFPPARWDVLNPDGWITWERAPGIGKTGTGSVMINNADYTSIGEKDDLRLPQFSLPATVDSAFFTFQIAAATYTDAATPNNVWDTLEVLISFDCGLTYTSLYRKWGGELATQRSPVRTGFVPTASDWRRDSINLAAYIGRSNILLAFRNTTGYENNIYLDDINVRTVTVNPNLKARGFLVTPNPASSRVSVQFYPQPAGLQAVQLFGASGQKLAEVRVGTGQPNSVYNFDVSRYPAGTYFVRAVFADRVVHEKILKL